MTPKELSQIKHLQNKEGVNIPQAGRVPALPVFKDSSLPPLPRSSVPEWTTTVRCKYSISIGLDSWIYIYIYIYKTYADDTLGANQLDEFICDCALAITLSIGLKVSEIAYMASLIGGSSMCLSMRVDYFPPSASPTPYPIVSAYNVDQRMCSRWCCHRTCGHVCHAWRWDHCQWCCMWW